MEKLKVLDDLEKLLSLACKVILLVFELEVMTQV